MRSLLLLSLALVGTGCGLSLGSGSDGDDTVDPECQIQSSQEKGPGYPYDLAMYESQVLPALKNQCGTAGCHAAPSGAGSFNIWSDAAPGNCSYAKGFNALAGMIDLANPAQSKVVIAIGGSHPTHPMKLGESDPTTQLLLSYATRASEQQNTTTAPPGASPYDYTVFQTVIQPILDTAETKGCAGATCHGAAAGIGGFKLVPTPAAGSPDLEANFLAVTSRSSLDAPETSTFFLKATTRHGGGASAVINAAQGAQILDWAAKAKANAGSQGGNCIPVSSFNVDVFRDEIQPILFGDVGTSTGCALGACHGQDRSGGALVLKETFTAEQNLQNFACFIDLTNPIASEILSCPLDQPGCRHRPHPGQDVFSGANDHNFQKVLSYLYGTKTTASPLDFAFYARAVNPIFNDITAVQGGAQNRTCADTVSCHGVNAAGQRAPNGSNFPLLANLTDKGSLAYNFSSAANFTNFLAPEGSSLFLYPTNEIANLDNPFATGLDHPGGADFAVDSREAETILAWAQGLRPDNDGFVRYWLVAGDYSVTQITSPTPVNEITVKPSIFDPSGAAQFNEGKWDALIAEDRDIDLGAEFPRAATAGRVAYAVIYVLNTSPVDINAQLTITTNNAVRLYADDRALLQVDNAAAGATGLVTFPAFSGAKKSTRVLLKLFQRQNDQNFAFTVQLKDELGNILNDTTGELVIKLGPDGGI